MAGNDMRGVLGIGGQVGVGYGSGPALMGGVNLGDDGMAEVRYAPGWSTTDAIGATEHIERQTFSVGVTGFPFPFGKREGFHGSASIGGDVQGQWATRTLVTSLGAETTGGNTAYVGGVLRLGGAFGIGALSIRPELLWSIGYQNHNEPAIDAFKNGPESEGANKLGASVLLTYTF